MSLIVESTDRYVEVYRSSNMIEASELGEILADAGIDAWVDNEFLQGAIGEAPLGWPTAPRIMVPERAAAQARRIAQDFDFQIAARANAEPPIDNDAVCLACNAPMAENQDACASCGWSFLP